MRIMPIIMPNKPVILFCYMPIMPMCMPIMPIIIPSMLIIMLT